jgi:hypothetical protein
LRRRWLRHVREKRTDWSAPTASSGRASKEKSPVTAFRPGDAAWRPHYIEQTRGEREALFSNFSVFFGLADQQDLAVGLTRFQESDRLLSRHLYYYIFSDKGKR